MKILVSSCLLGCNCKYNGKNNYNKEVVQFLKNYEAVCVCPEQLGGLSTPRLPSEIHNHRVIQENGQDVTDYFKLGATLALYIAQKNHCQVAICKTRSPSCGFGEIYDGTFTSKVIDGNGITADLLFKNGIEVFNETNFKKIMEGEEHEQCKKDKKTDN